MPVRYWKLIHQRILVLIHLLFIHRTCHRWLKTGVFSPGVFPCSSPKMWTKTMGKRCNQWPRPNKRKLNYQTRRYSAQKRALYKLLLHKNCCKPSPNLLSCKEALPSIIFGHFYFMPVSILQLLYIPLHIGFTHIYIYMYVYLYGLHILLQKNPPFRNTCGIHLSQLALRFLLPCGQMALTQLRRFTQGHRFGTNLRGQNFVTDRGPGPVFSHGWDRYTDFVDFIYHHVHASCLISEHPVEVVFIQVDFLGHRGFLFELKGSQSGVPPQHLDSSWFFGGSGRWFAQFVWAGKRQHLHFRPQTTWEILSKKLKCCVQTNYPLSTC